MYLKRNATIQPMKGKWMCVKGDDHGDRHSALDMGGGHLK